MGKWPALTLTLSPRERGRPLEALVFLGLMVPLSGFLDGCDLLKGQAHTKAPDQAKGFPLPQGEGTPSGYAGFFGG
jgi:hypothetical protein